MPNERSFAVSLTIPDNEAFTAAETLRHMGLAVGDVRRATIWTLEVDTGSPDTLAATLATVETICNPNTHDLVERSGSRPNPGEVWIAAAAEPALTTVGGRALPGVRRIHRRTAWTLLDTGGKLVEPAVLDSAVETFLCNSAFEKAIR